LVATEAFYFELAIIVIAFGILLRLAYDELHLAPILAFKSAGRDDSLYCLFHL